MASSDTVLSIAPSFNPSRVTVEPYLEAAERLPPHVSRDCTRHSEHDSRATRRARHSLSDAPQIPYISRQRPITPTDFKVDADVLVRSWDERQQQHEGEQHERDTSERVQQRPIGQSNPASETQRRAEVPIWPIAPHATRGNSKASHLHLSLHAGPDRSRPVSRRPVPNSLQSASRPPVVDEQPLSLASRSTAISSEQRQSSTVVSTTTTARTSVERQRSSSSPRLSTPRLRLRVVNVTERDSPALREAVRPVVQTTRARGKAPADLRIERGLAQARAEIRGSQRHHSSHPRGTIPATLSGLTGLSTQSSIPPPSARDEWIFALLDQEKATNCDEVPRWKRLVNKMQGWTRKCLRKLETSHKSKMKSTSANHRVSTYEDEICQCAKRSRGRSLDLALD